MLEIYISDKTLEKIWVESRNSNWGKIISKQGVVYISEEEPSRLLDKDGVLWQIEMSGIHLKPSTEYIQKIIDGTESISEKPFGVFILDIDPVQALKMQNENGVICMSSKRINDDILTEVSPNYKFYEKDEEGDWNEILQGVSNDVLPSNAVIVIDNYLFANDGRMQVGTPYEYTDSGGIKNIQSILDCIIPRKSSIDYHVLIVCESDSIKNGLTFKDITTQLNKLKKELKKTRDPGLNITCEIIAATKGSQYVSLAHNRRIISNYFIIDLLHKVNAFSDTGKSNCEQCITINRLYSRGLKERSDVPAKSHRIVINNYKKFISDWISAILNDGRDITDYIFGQNGQEKSIIEIKNRLLV